MKGLMKAYSITDRTIHLVDSFKGLPIASTMNDTEEWSRIDYLRVSLVRCLAFVVKLMHTAMPQPEPLDTSPYSMSSSLKYQKYAPVAWAETRQRCNSWWPANLMVLYHDDLRSGVINLATCFPAARLLILAQMSPDSCVFRIGLYSFHQIGLQSSSPQQPRDTSTSAVAFQSINATDNHI